MKNKIVSTIAFTGLLFTLCYFMTPSNASVNVLGQNQPAIILEPNGISPQSQLIERSQNLNAQSPVPNRPQNNNGTSLLPGSPLINQNLPSNSTNSNSTAVSLQIPQEVPLPQSNPGQKPLSDNINNLQQQTNTGSFTASSNIMSDRGAQNSSLINSIQNSNSPQPSVEPVSEKTEDVAIENAPGDNVELYEDYIKNHPTDDHFKSEAYYNFYHGKTSMDQYNGILKQQNNRNISNLDSLSNFNDILGLKVDVAEDWQTLKNKIGQKTSDFYFWALFKSNQASEKETALSVVSESAPTTVVEKSYLTSVKDGISSNVAAFLPTNASNFISAIIGGNYGSYAQDLLVSSSIMYGTKKGFQLVGWVPKNALGQVIQQNVQNALNFGLKYSFNNYASAIQFAKTGIEYSSTLAQLVLSYATAFSAYLSGAAVLIAGYSIYKLFRTTYLNIKKYLAEAIDHPKSYSDDIFFQYFVRNIQFNAPNKSLETYVGKILTSENIKTFGRNESGFVTSIRDNLKNYLTFDQTVYKVFLALRKSFRFNKQWAQNVDGGIQARLNDKDLGVRSRAYLEAKLEFLAKDDNFTINQSTFLGKDFKKCYGGNSEYTDAQVKAARQLMSIWLIVEYYRLDELINRYYPYFFRKSYLIWDWLFEDRENIDKKLKEPDFRSKEKERKAIKKDQMMVIEESNKVAAEGFFSVRRRHENLEVDVRHLNKMLHNENGELSLDTHLVMSERNIAEFAKSNKLNQFEKIAPPRKSYLILPQQRTMVTRNNKKQTMLDDVVLRHTNRQQKSPIVETMSFGFFNLFIPAAKENEDWLYSNPDLRERYELFFKEI